MTAPVLWWTSNPGVAAQGYWDQALLEDLLSGALWRVPGGVRFEHAASPVDVGMDNGAVVVVPGRMEDGDPGPLQLLVDGLDWVLLVVTSDEEGSFPWWDLRHPRMLVWAQTPHPDRPQPHHVLPLGYPTGCREAMAEDAAHGRNYDWSFFGQVTHRRREQCLEAMKRQPNGLSLQTDSFADGVAQRAFWRILASSRVAPCPGGPVTPETFRIYEALEAGCVPLVDAKAGERETEGPYWGPGDAACPGPVVVDDWAEVGRALAHVLADWPLHAAAASAAWQQQKRELAYALDAHAARLAKQLDCGGDAVADLVTVVVTTSPVPSHPDTGIVEQTVQSLYDSGLEGCEVLVMADGVRPEQQGRAEAYHEYLRRLAMLCEHRWPNAVPFIAPRFVHQAGLARWALEQVRTPLLLFVEHDTPLVGDIPWYGLCRFLLAEGNLVRFHHEDRVLDEHRHLMVGARGDREAGVTLLATAQWSQRPHLARADYYRRIMATFFGMQARTMVEDVMHGVVDHAWREHGVAGWREHGLYLYAPRDGGMKRSTHLDGRGGDPKFPMSYAYDGGTPPGAPAP